jgi:hypothetical protein
VKKSKVKRRAIEDETRARIQARRARARAIIEGLRGQLEELEAVKQSLTVPDEEWVSLSIASSQRPSGSAFPNGLPARLEIRDYSGRLCSTTPTIRGTKRQKKGRR